MTSGDVIVRLREAFAAVPHPGDAFLVGSAEGPEPEAEVGPFRGRPEWQTIEAAFLDAHGGALSFFSEGAFRFYLPAYLVADLEVGLQEADPLWHLTGAFQDASVELPAEGRTFVKVIGRRAFLNPRRYGAMTFLDHARYRLSVFAREEAAAIVAYLEHERTDDPRDVEAPQIDAALELYWRERAATAPTIDELATHVHDEEAYLAAIVAQIDE